MDPFADCAFAARFGDLPDPRIDRCKRHGLLDVVAIAPCAVLCGADTWVDAAGFGRSQAAWRRTFLARPTGIPCHDASGRV
ncbi:MAG TPA: transposase family protein, partial [Thermomicrobiales bacterium]